MLQDDHIKSPLISMFFKMLLNRLIQIIKIIYLPYVSIKKLILNYIGTERIIIYSNYSIYGIIRSSMNSSIFKLILINTECYFTITNLL